MLNAIEMFYWLVVGHAITDLALQHEWIGKYKHPTIDTEGYDWSTKKYNPLWPYVLTGHSIINGAGVAWITGIWWLGPLETVLHFATDYLSTRKKIGMFVDQFSHFMAKVAWLLVWIYMEANNGQF